LANPPGGVGGQTGAVADIEAINRLHQTADGFLQQIGIAQSVMAESFGNVSGEADVGGGEAVFAMDVAIMDLADVDVVASLVVAIIADELCHRPRLMDRFLGTE